MANQPASQLDAFEDLCCMYYTRLDGSVLNIIIPPVSNCLRRKFLDNGVIYRHVG